MNREDQIILACVQGLERGLIPLAKGWTLDAANQLYEAILARQKPRLPDGVTANEIYEAIRDVLIGLEDVEKKYIPKWAKQLMNG